MPNERQPAGYYEYRALAAESSHDWEDAGEEWGYASLQALGERRERMEARSRRCFEKAGITHSH